LVQFFEIIFPFFFWIFPSPVFKVEDRAIVEQLKVGKAEKMGFPLLTFLAGFAYALGILLTPLMDYFEVQSSALVNTILLILALILVGLLYYSISHRRKKKLESVVQLETLPKRVLWIRSSSSKQLFKLLAAYIWLLGFVGFFGFAAYIQTGNIMVLIIASGLLFVLLLSSRITVEEGHTTVRFKGHKKVV